jgi:hypothetical protein
MKRRTAIRSLGLTVGGLVTFPAWASAWTPESIGVNSLTSPDDDTLLAEIAETFIPETNTPGAKSLKVNQFVARMINDCYSDQAKKTFQQGLLSIDQVALKSAGKTFMECSALQRTDVLQQMSAAADSKFFVSMVKNLTVRGYTKSQYYLVNIAKFNMAPGFFNGCVPIK